MINPKKIVSVQEAHSYKKKVARLCGQTVNSKFIAKGKIKCKINIQKEFIKKIIKPQIFRPYNNI